MGPNLVSRRSHRSSTHTSPIVGLPPEILHRCLAHLDSEERCQTVPLVSKMFLQNHLNYPPGRKQWGLHGPGSVTASMVQWLLYVAEYVRHPRWSCWSGWKDHPGLTADSTLLCSFMMENLRGKGGQLLSSLLQCLSGVTEMEVWPDIVHRNFRAELLQRSAGFQSLQAVTLFTDLRDNPLPTPDEMDALFGALARVPILKSVNIDSYSHRWYYEDIVPLFRSVGLMTQIRTLKFDGKAMGEFLEEGSLLPQSLSLLVKLEELQMSSARIPVASCSPIVGLPSLESLKISLKPQDHPEPLLLASQNLTRLEIYHGTPSSVEQYLPAAMPCLRTLKYLALTNMELTTFPNSVARALECLTRLDLSSNPIAKCPPGLAQINSLQYLCIGYSRELQLRLCDGATFAALPNLQIVDFSWGAPLCKKRDGSKFFGAYREITSFDRTLQRRNAGTWKEIKSRHPQLQGLVVAF